jgi:hypothetical protein
MKYLLLTLLAMPAIAEIPNTFTPNTPAVASQVNENFTSLDTRLSSIESDTESLDRFNYSYNKKDLPVGSKFPFEGREYEIAVFEVRSILDDSIYRVKIPVRGGQSGIKIMGTSGYERFLHNPNSSIDSYKALFNYDTTMGYGWGRTEGATREQFEAAGELTRTTIYTTGLSVRKGGSSLTCRLEFSILPDNVQNVFINHEDGVMTFLYNDGTPPPVDDIPITPEYSDLITDCINSDNYSKYQLTISTTLVLSAYIYLDKETYFKLDIYNGLSPDTFIAEQVEPANFDPNNRDYSNSIEWSNAPTAAKRDVFWKQKLELFNYIVINKL